MTNNDGVEVFTCEHCGGTMSFDIATQSLKCEYCESQRHIDGNDEVKEYDFSDIVMLEEQSSWNEEVTVVACENCGGQTIVSHYQTALVCIYCGSSQVLKTKEIAGIKPEGVLTFKIDKYEVTKIVERWFNRRWLAPNNLKLRYQTDKIIGVYVPFWTYDAKTQSTYNGQGGQYYYETHEVNGKKETVRKVRWYNVHGQLNRFFDDILVNGSKHFNDEIISKIEPYNTISGLECYQPEYIAGYMAERYSYDVKECFNIAKQKMLRQLEEDARTEILQRYDTVRGISVRSTFEQIKYKHVLLPIYSATYDYNGNKYQFIINGETGKISGTYPYSWVKLLLIFVMGTLMLLIFLYYFNQ